MIGVLIVDDEYLIRQLVKNSVRWENYGFTVVGEAENGREAIDLAVRLRPGLCIVDINMPLMDGLEFSFLVRDRLPGTKVVVLTGYDEIDFVKSALRAGVSDYLLKPIEGAAVEKILRDIKNSFGISEYAYPSQWFPKMPTDNPSLTASALCVVDPTPPADGPLPPVKTIADCLLSNLPDGWNPAAYQDEKGRPVIALSPESSDKLSQLRSLCERALRKGADEHGLILSIGFASAESGADSLPALYERALRALEEKFYRGPGRVFLNGGLRPAKGPTLDRTAFLIGLNSGDFAACSALVEAYFSAAAKDSCSPHLVRLAAFEAAAMIFDTYREADDTGHPSEEQDFVSRIYGMETRAQVQDYLIALLEDRLSRRSEGFGGRQSRVVQRAKDFIDRNFRKRDLSLEGIADAVSVSATYLSSIFKAQLGTSVIEYMTAIRLEHARRYMQENPLALIYEVAESSGYGDPYYFSKAFKKKYGISPSKCMDQFKGRPEG